MHFNDYLCTQQLLNWHRFGIMRIYFDICLSTPLLEVAFASVNCLLLMLHSDAFQKKLNFRD